MTQPLTAGVGPELANPHPSSTMPETSPACDDVFMAPNSNGRRMLDAWTPTERRRLGLLSTRSYEKTGLMLPTDMWSYQQLFIDQQRDRNNPWAPRKTGK